MTDNTCTYEIILWYEGRQRLRIEYSQTYNRKAHEDFEIEAGIERKWVSRKEKNGALFNGKKFRFGGVEICDDECVVRLGITDYKTYLGTHFGDDVGRFGEDWMARPLGNVVVPETRDGKTVLLIRSGYTSEGVGGVVFPGGHPEPDMVDNLRDGDNTKVMKELWDGARREVVEELFIEDDVGLIGELKFLGFVKRCVDGKVSMVFSVRIEMSGEEVLKRFSERNDGVESNGIMLEDLSKMDQVSQGRRNGAEVVAETRGAAQVWVKRKNEITVFEVGGKR